MPNDPTDADKFGAYLTERRGLKRIERSNAAKVLRRFAKHVLPMGYHRRSTFFAREAGHLIQFLHIHKFSFGPHFRVHVCIRVLNDPRNHPALSGITNGALKLSFEDNDASLTECAKQMTTFLLEVAEPWFSKWNEQSLINSGSPISKDTQEALVRALDGNADPANVHQSRILLGLAR